MKIIYQSDDGIKFNTEQECIDYEKKGKLLEHIMINIGCTYNDDAGFSIIQETDVESYIKAHINKINMILGIRVAQ